MDVGLDGLSQDSESLTRILGETARPLLDKDGRKVMQGYGAIRGTVEDYRVASALSTDFAFATKKQDNSTQRRCHSGCTSTPCGTQFNVCSTLLFVVRRVLGIHDMPKDVRIWLRQ